MTTGSNPQPPTPIPGAAAQPKGNTAGRPGVQWSLPSVLLASKYANHLDDSCFIGFALGVKHGGMTLEKAYSSCTAVIDRSGVRPHEKATALCNRGTLQCLKNDLVQAVSDFTAAIDLPGATQEVRSKALMQRGHVWARWGDREKALSDFTAAVDSGADSVLAQSLINRAVLWNSKSDYDKALSDYDRLLALPGLHAREKHIGLCSRGSLWRDKGDLDKAISDYSTLIDAPGGAAVLLRNEALVLRGVIWLLKGAEEKALSDLRAVAEADLKNLLPIKVRALGCMAFVLCVMKNFTDSQSASRRALEIDLNAAWVRGCLGMALLNLGKQTEAAAEYLQAVQSGATRSEIRDMVSNLEALRAARPDLEQSIASIIPTLQTHMPK